MEFRNLKQTVNGHFLEDRDDAPVSENCTSEVFDIPDRPGDEVGLRPCGKPATTLITYPEHTGYMILCGECKYLFLEQHNQASRRETIHIENYSLARNEELSQRAKKLWNKVAEVRR